MPKPAFIGCPAQTVDIPTSIRQRGVAGLPMALELGADSFRLPMLSAGAVAEQRSHQSAARAKPKCSCRYHANDALVILRRCYCLMISYVKRRTVCLIYRPYGDTI
jgi:hypothetical protein